MTVRRWIALGAAVAVLVAFAVVANARRTQHIGRAGSVALGTGQPVGMTAGPTAYSVDYRVEERIGRSVRVSTDKVSVRRPLESRLETWAGAPPGRTLVSTDITTLGRRSHAAAQAETSRSDEPPGVAAADVRLDTSVAAAVRAGVVQRRERRRVLGRVCQVYRSAARFSGAYLQQPAATSFVDNCVSRDGMVLEELDVAGGTARLRRVAVRVNLHPVLTDALFAVGKATLTVPDGGGSTRRVAPTSTPPGQFWQLDGLDGFSLAGRFSVVPPQPENFTDPAREGFRHGGVSDVFVRGADVVVVDQGGTLNGQPLWTLDARNPAVDLGALGHGELLFSARGAEARVLTGRGHYVRVFGTVSPDDLVAVARQLHQVAGSQLVYLD